MTDRLPDIDGAFVHDVIRVVAQRHPLDIAMSDQSLGHMTYRELIQRSAALSEELRNRGVRADVPVAVWLDDPIDVIVSMLGVLDAGGVYAPIDAAYPVGRVALVLRNLAPAALLTDVDVPEEIRALAVPVVRPVPAGTQLTARSSESATLEPENVAYVIHTSGSTGTPKGVAMSHRGLTRLIKWQIADGPRALRTAHLTPIGFDVIFQEVLSTLGTGGTLVTVPASVRRDPELLLQLLFDQSVQRLFLPYVLLNQLATASTRLGLVPHALRHVITAGERLIITDAIASFFRALPACRFDNHYGPTETHLVTRFTMSADVDEWPSAPPIGTAVAGTRVHVLDAVLEPVTDSHVGEIYVAGDGLARGYVNAPTMTADRFVPDPFSTSPGNRMYRTGDLGSIGSDGVVTFVGRSDEQVKVRGFRVEPAEVELALTAHPHVHEAAVTLRAVADGINALVAYVATDGVPIAIPQLVKHLRSRLPDYMVPSRFVFLDKLALTLSGKVDRRSLADVPLAVSGRRGADSLADCVRAIWERVLGHSELEVEDDFFDVGGDSLLATWVVSELSEAVGCEIDLSVFLEDSTMAGLVRTLDRMALAPSGARPLSEITTLRTGPSQRALFLVHALGGEVLAYRALARAIGAPVRVFGLRWHGAAVDRGQWLSLSEMASIHLDKLRAVQPTGPYLIAGWSFGGVLAFEIAQQLTAVGEQVDFLGLLDANPILDPTTGRLCRETPLFDRLGDLLADVEQRTQAGDTLLALNEWHLDPEVVALLGASVPEGMTAAHLLKHLQVTRAAVRAAMNYRAIPYRGAIDLYQPEETPDARRGALAREMRALAGLLRVHDVPGNHYSILRAPHVDIIARAIDEALESRTPVAVGSGEVLS